MIKRDGSDYLKWGCMRSIISLLPTGSSQHTPILEKQGGAPTWKLSNELLWKGSATRGNLATEKKSQYQLKYMLHLEYFHYFTLLSVTRQPTENHCYKSQVPLSPNPPSSMGKISHFTSQVTGVSGLPLPQFVNRKGTATPVFYLVK